MKTKHIFFSRFLFFPLFLTMLITLNAQTYYALQIDRNIRFKAADITAKYQPKLVMGTDQAMQFKLVVAKYLVKRQSVEQDPTLSPMDKYNLLKKVSSDETSAMADVLESYRWQEYMRIKNEIQPIPEPYELRKDLIAREETTSQ